MQQNAHYDNGPVRQTPLIPLQTESLDIKISRNQASLALAAFKEAPILLPADGEYLISIKDEVLHIHETNRGIPRHSLTEALEVQVEQGEIRYSFNRVPGIRAIVVHSSPCEHDPASRTPQELKTEPLLSEYSAILARAATGVLDPRQALRLVELTEELTGRSSGLQERIDREVVKRVDEIEASRPVYKPPVTYGG